MTIAVAVTRIFDIPNTPTRLTPWLTPHTFPQPPHPPGAPESILERCTSVLANNGKGVVV